MTYACCGKSEGYHVRLFEKLCFKNAFVGVYTPWRTLPCLDSRRMKALPAAPQGGDSVAGGCRRRCCSSPSREQAVLHGAGGGGRRRNTRRV